MPCSEWIKHLMSNSDTVSKFIVLNRATDFMKRHHQIVSMRAYFHTYMHVHTNWHTRWHTYRHAH